MKRFLSVFLAVLLLLALFPQSALPVRAEDELPDLVNLRVSPDGLITWDPYPGAAHYYVYGGEYWDSFRIEPEEGCELDFARLLEDGYAPSGTHSIWISAEDEWYDNIAYSHISWDYTSSLSPLPVPSNPRWDGYTARWDPVQGAENGYIVCIYNVTESYDITYVYSAEGENETALDCSGYLGDQSVRYAFQVRARGSAAGSQSEWSAYSASIPGRFVKGDLQLKLNGDVLRWEPYLDSEGNYAHHYCLHQDGENPAWLQRDWVYSNTLSLQTALMNVDAPAGVYRYSITAESCDSITVSKESNTVTYSYTPDPNLQTVTLLGWEAPDAWPDVVYFNGTWIGSDEQYSVPVNQGNLDFGVDTQERWALTGVRLEYGGEIHSEPDKMGFSHVGGNKYTIWVDPPAEDFRLILDQEADYDLLDHAEVSFPVTPGARCPQNDTLTPDEAPYFAWIVNCVCSNPGSFTEWYLPGDEWEVSVCFEAKSWEYYCFAPDAAFTVNGQPAQVLKRSEDGMDVWVRAAFTVPEASDFTLEQVSDGTPYLPVTIDASGVGHWTPPEDAASIFVEYWQYGDDFENGETSFDLKTALENSGAATSWYVLRVSSKDQNWDNTARGYAAWHYTGLDPLPAPTNPRWDGYTACWDPVDGASSYVVDLYRVEGGKCYSERFYSGNCADLSSALEDRANRYYFTVQACGDRQTTADSAPSALSPAIPGRFELQPFTVTLSGDILSWDAVTDTEGNLSDHYYVSIDGPSYHYFRWDETSIDLRQCLELYGDPESEYDIDVYAANAEDMAVSFWSNRVTYSFTPDPNLQTVRLLGWDSEETWPDEVLFNGFPVDCNEGCFIPIDQGTLSFEVVTAEHWELTGVQLEYGGETHSEPENVGFSHSGGRRYTVWVVLPEEDFRLVFSQEPVYDLLDHAEASFPVIPGARCQEYGLAPEDAPFEASMDNYICSNPSGSTIWYLPGDDWEVSIRFEAKTSEYYVFSPDATFTVNGRPAQVLQRSEDGERVWVRAAFTVPEASDVTLERYDSEIPYLPVTIDASGVAHWTVPADGKYTDLSFYHYFDIIGDVTSFDLKARLDEYHAPTGWYVLWIRPEDQNWNAIAEGYVAYHYTGLDRLPAPTNPRWEGSFACWDPVEGAAAYRVVPCVVDRLDGFGSVETTDTRVDLNRFLGDRELGYVFYVQALVVGQTIADSAPSVFSPPIPGRFEHLPFEVTLSGDILFWDPVIDSEGNPADHYYVNINGESYHDFRWNETSIDLRQCLDLYGDPDGDYWISVCAYSVEGLQVSAWSDYVEYAYAADPARPTVTWEGFEASNLEALYLNGLEPEWYDSRYTLTVGETIELRLIPKERWRVAALNLRYEDEDHPLDVAQLDDGSCTARFTVPDSDVSLIVTTEYIIYDLPEIGATFDHTPGTLLGERNVETVPAENAHYYAAISEFENPHGEGCAVMLPGAEYTATLDFWTEWGYRFPDDVTVTVNGCACSVDVISDDHTVLSVTYSFQCTTTVDLITVRGLNVPECGEAPDDDVYTAQSDPFTARENRARWFRVDANGSWTELESGQLFEDGVTYVAEILYDNHPACPWADTVEARVDLSEEDLPLIDYVYVGEAPGLEGQPKVVEVHFKPLGSVETIDRVDLTVTKPVDGQKPDMNVRAAANAPYTASVDYWYLCDYPYTEVAETDTFVAGTEYALRLNVRAKEGYRLTADTKIYVNGVLAEIRFGGWGDVEVTWIALQANPFTDVEADDWYYDSILWAFYHVPPITTGTTATTFAPKRVCSRSEVVTFLWRAAGQPEPTTTENPFTDVKTTDWYYKAVLWAVENGVTSGTGGTTFSPKRQCMRGEVVTFLWRAAGQPDPTSIETAFTDVDPTAFYYQAMLWAVEKGITKGTTATTFAPKKTCTRGEIVTFLYRAYA